MTSCPRRLSAAAMPATWSFASWGCDQEKGVTRQIRIPRECSAGEYSRSMDDVVIQVRENGPYKITGPITVVDWEGREFALPEASAFPLCRCGHSANKPFCDGSHKRIGFIADDSAPRVTDA